jgi:hypothetical protein
MKTRIRGLPKKRGASPGVSKARRLSWALFALAGGVACVIALIQVNGSVSKTKVAVLAVMGALFFSGALYCLDWWKTPRSIVARISLPAWAIIIWGGMCYVGWKVRPQPQSPKLAIIGYEVILFKPNQNPFANVFFQNIGGEGRIVVYSYSGVALSTASPLAVRRDLENVTKKLVSKGGGLAFTLRPQETKWFTVTGPSLSPQQAELLKNGTYSFYFSGTIVNGYDGKNYDFCSFVEGNKPNVVIQCPEQ